MVNIWQNYIQMRPVFLREMNGKYVTKLYSNDVNILREINGKYVKETCSNDARNMINWIGLGQ